MAGITRRICELIQVQRGKGRHLNGVNDLVLSATHLRRIESGGGEFALVFFWINQVAETCELVHSHVRSSRYMRWPRRAHAMTQPAKRIPRWLTIDLLVIVISLAIIGIGIGIGIVH